MMDLARPADREPRPSGAAASCLDDQRQRGSIRHRMVDLVRRRVFAIVPGYEDPLVEDRGFAGGRGHRAGHGFGHHRGAARSSG